MVARIVYRQERGREKPYRERICGLPFLTVSLFEPPELPSKKLERRLEKLERLCLGAGVSRVIVPEGFPHTRRLNRLQPVNPLTFYRAVADFLALQVLTERGVPYQQGRVALTAARPCAELYQTACRLCRRVREVRIDLPGDEGERLACELQRQFGLPVVPPVAPADVTVSFGGRAGDLQLWEEGLSLSGLRLKADGIEPPAEVEQQVLALLWERGRLKRDDLRVTDVL